MKLCSPGRVSAVLAFAAMMLPAHAAQAQEKAQEKAQDQPEDKVLRVCQDPNNLPFSNRKLEGFENKLAALFAQELGWELRHTWYPQRMGFIRNTLRAKEPGTDTFKCDLVTGVPAGFDMGATTAPYYRSVYAMAYVKGKGLDSVEKLEDLLALPPEKRKSLRLGVFMRSPVIDWLLRNDLIEQVVSYQDQSGDPDQYPGEMIEKDLAAGKIDIAFAWGPIAGYYAKQARGVEIKAVPLAPRKDAKLDFSIVMAVRFGDKTLKERIDQLIAKNPQKIEALLAEYGVPQLNKNGELLAPKR